MTDVYTIKNYRNIASDYGDHREDGYSVTVYRNDQRLGTYTFPKNGGLCAEWTISTADWERLVKCAWAHSDETKGDDDSKTDAVSACEDGLIVAGFLEPLIDKYEQAKQFRRWCKQRTLFTIKGDKDGDFRTVKATYSPKVHFYIVKQYGDSVTAIWNARAVKVSLKPPQESHEASEARRISQGLARIEALSKAIIQNNGSLKGGA
jgi:hypothetical protein